MKTVLNFWLSLLAYPAFAQETTDYNRSASEPAGKSRPSARSAKARRAELTQLVARYGEAYIRER